MAEDIDLFWYKRGENAVGEMRPGANRQESTYMGHWFVVRTKDGLLVTWKEIQMTRGRWKIEPQKCESAKQVPRSDLANSVLPSVVFQKLQKTSGLSIHSIELFQILNL